MTRTLFIVATALFWLLIGGFRWIALQDNAGRSAREVSVPAPVQNVDITLHELAQHASAQSCWVAIRGTVYDISAYVPEHPSRPEVVLAWCGKDASHAYATKLRNRPHSAFADAQLAPYRLGALATAR